MRVSDLDKIINIEAPTRTPDNMGGFTVTFPTKYSGIYAAIWPISAKEQSQADQTTMMVTHRIRIRYKAVMRAGWRVKYGNRYFNIVSIINPNEANKMLDMLCVEVKV